MASRGVNDYIAKWKLDKSFSVHIDKGFLMCGFISEDEICVQDELDSDTYVLDISTKRIKKVITSDLGMYTTSCVSVDSNLIVCGKRGGDCTGDSLDGYITLYDRQWNVIRDISIPTKACHTPKWTTVHVDVDRDGMILAAQSEQNNMYVINPADGKIVNTITMPQGKKVEGELQVLSSGDIVVKTDFNDEEFTVISRSGEQKVVIHRDENSYCSVDKQTDTLYITYLDGKSICTVDEVSCDGIIKAKRIVEYKNTNPYSHFVSQSVVTPSGKLVGFYGFTFCVFKK